MTDLSDFKRGQNCGVIKCSKEYCLENNDSIWERRKNLLTEAKLSKKAKPF